MIKCDELSKEKSDDQFVCYQNQGYEDEESCKPIQEETGDQTRSEDASQSDVSKHNEESPEEKPGEDQFTCYQNEGYGESESDGTKDGDRPQEEKPDDQPESIDVLLWKRWVKLTLDSVQFNIINSQDVSWHDIFINKHPCVSILTGVCVYQDLNVDYLHKIVLLVYIQYFLHSFCSIFIT